MNIYFDSEQHSGCCAKVNKKVLVRVHHGCVYVQISTPTGGKAPLIFVHMFDCHVRLDAVYVF